MSYDSAFSLDAFALDDDTAPALVQIAPAPGAVIETNAIVSLEVSDAGHMSDTSIVVEMAGVESLVFDGFVFCGPFRSLSTFESVESEEGHRVNFHVARSGGWTSAPTFRAVVRDTDGNEAEGP